MGKLLLLWQVSSYRVNNMTTKHIAVQMENDNGLFSDVFLKKLITNFPEVNFNSFQNSVDEIDNLDNVEVLLGIYEPQSFSKLTSLKWFHTYEVGVDKILNDKNSFSKPVLLTNSQGATTEDVAEHAVSLLLLMHRYLHQCPVMQLNRQWPPFSFHPTRQHTLRGKNLLILGLGSIGQSIADIASALGLSVFGTNQSTPKKSVLEWVKQADFVINCLPLTDKTQFYVNLDLLKIFKSSAFYINVGRGKTTVSDDLVIALEKNMLAGAALDVTYPEPLRKDHPLWTMNNVFLTPHVAANSLGTLQKIYALAFENVSRYLTDQPLLNQINLNRGY